MSDEDLNTAAQFIQQGQSEKAQPILRALIKANPQDLAAWSYYVKTCRTPEERLQALELCLKFNPGNEQVSAAIDKLRARLAGPLPVSSPSVAPQVAEPYSPAPSYYESPYQAVAMSAASVPLVEPASALAQPNDPLPGQTTGLLFPDEPPSRPFPWYEVWGKALTQATAPSYFEILRDPTADTGRAFLWVFTASIVTGLVLLLGAFLGSSLSKALEQAGSLTSSQINSNLFYIIVLILIPVGAGFNVFWAMLGAGFYNLLAKMFGGVGNFSRTIYLMAAISAPLSIVNSLLSLIPLVSCLTLPLSMYAFWMNVRAIQVAHRMPSTGRAFIVVLIPVLISLGLLCLLGILFSQVVMKALQAQQGTY